MANDSVDLTSLPFTAENDVLVDAAKQEFKADAIKGKVVGLVVGPHWLPSPLYQAISVVVEPYEELKKKGKPVVFVYVTLGRDENLIQSLDGYGQGSQVDKRPDAESFEDLVKKLPAGWLAVPLGSSAVRSSLEREFKAGIISLSFVGSDGKIATKDGWPVVEKWGSDSFPFTKERIDELEAEFKALQANQSLKSLLVTDHRDFVIRNDGTEVKVTELEGKPLALYFSAHWCPPCRAFTPVLKQVYEKLKAEHKDLEIVFVSGDEDEEAFRGYFEDMPWLAVPFSDQQAKKQLNSLFEVEGIPTLVTLDSHGKTVQTDTVSLIRKHDVDAYPFTPERAEELRAAEEAKRANQTVEDLLVTADRDYVINHAGEQVKVSSLHGKTIGLYFSAHWCPPCRSFTPTLVAVYKELQEDGKPFEIVFVSSDRDEESFQSYYGEMPWLALPFSDRKAKADLTSYFEVEGIPTLVILTGDGKTATLEGRTMVDTLGARSFPFTSEREQELAEEQDRKIEKLAKEVLLTEHEHPLTLMRSPYPQESYYCDVCGDAGQRWAYRCNDCGYDAHVMCVVNEDEEHNEEEEHSVTGEGKEHDHGEKQQPGFVCEGDVCRRA
eukprot:TRINITY_DN800_c0_g1_i1.p1 TRINITY_DN800_c0_g1~~TRINITY_DN800_c0_g1_i1.p1  ORF type:complete len:608 (+),score=153.44 TRINITY_DN800_c0_g1_i1:128-1951(+)